MKLFSGIIIIILSVLCLFNTASAQDTSKQVFEIKVEESGWSSSNGETRPIYSLIVGNPHPNEVLTSQKSYFGPFAINGKTYQRLSTDKNLWYAVTWRMPRGIEETKQFTRELLLFNGNIEQYSFYSKNEPEEPQKILPPPFNVLTRDDLEIVSYLVKYQDGSIRIGLVSWTTELEHINTLLRVISSRTSN